MGIFCKQLKFKVTAAGRGRAGGRVGNSDLQIERDFPAALLSPSAQLSPGLDFRPLTVGLVPCFKLSEPDLGLKFSR